MTVYQKKNRQTCNDTITRLAIFCAEKCKNSKTSTGTGARCFSKYVQMDWQSYRI